MYAYWTQHRGSGRPDRPVISDQDPADLGEDMYVLVYEGDDEIAADNALNDSVYADSDGFLFFK